MSDYSDVADRLEFLTWAEGKPISRATLKEQLESVLPPGGDDPDELADQVFEEVVRRRIVLKQAYPFDASQFRISYRGDGTVYLFCLGLSVVSHLAITPKVRDFMFEKLACNAAQSYFGNAIGIQTGAKWRQHGHASFSDMVTSVGILIKELGRPKRTTQPGGGDGGWDVILVKPFADGIYPRLIVGGNCATGKTDWQSKGSETVFPHWFRHFYDKQPEGPYFEFFAAPFAADDDERSRKTGKETFLFDRFRLAEFGSPVTGMDSWLSRIRPEAKNITYI